MKSIMKYPQLLEFITMLPRTYLKQEFSVADFPQVLIFE